jgi:hypothetical protein
MSPRRITRLAAMGHRTRLGLIVATALAAAALLVTGCGGGSSGDIPSAQAAQLQSTLDEVQNAAASGNCSEAALAAKRFVQQVDQLPASAGADLKTALRNGGLQLQSLVSCSSQQTTTTTTTTSGATGVGGVTP